MGHRNNGLFLRVQLLMVKMLKIVKWVNVDSSVPQGMFCMHWPT